MDALLSLSFSRFSFCPHIFVCFLQKVDRKKRFISGSEPKKDQERFVAVWRCDETPMESLHL